MKSYFAHFKSSLAIRIVFSLVVIMITGCQVSTSGPKSPPTEVVERLTSTATNTPLRPIATSTVQVTPVATDSPTRPATATPARQLTSTAVITPLEDLPVSRTPSIRVAETAPVRVYQTTITLPTYPFKDYLVEQLDPVYNIPVFYFNRAAFEAAAPTPTPLDYTGVVLENPYLRLTFMPE